MNVFYRTNITSGIRYFSSVVENKKIADEVIQHVRRKIIHSATRGITPPFTDEKFDDFIKTDEKIGEQRDLRKQIYYRQTKEKKNTFVSYDILAHLAKQSGYGNCGEMGVLGLMHFSEVNFSGRAGMFQIRRSETAPLPQGISSATSRTHTFLIIGLGDDNAVVADPYAEEESYPLSTMYTRLHNYYGLDSQARPKLAKIEPTMDSIHLLCSNIFSADEFIKPFLTFEKVRSQAEEITALLNSFHISQSREKRINIAVEIINKGPLILNALNTLEGMVLKAYKPLLEQLSQSLHEVVEDEILRINFHAQKMAGVVKQMEACQDNVHTLHSQLEKFQNPTALSFKLTQDT